ncbi:MAG: twin transmembrane helix small protein [Gammaproteobacteria bacterium]
MLVKFIIIGGLFAVLISLGLALMRLMRGAERSDATVRALTLRVALSIGLFVLLMIAYATGWLTPHGIFG